MDRNFIEARDLCVGQHVRVMGEARSPFNLARTEASPWFCVRDVRHTQNHDGESIVEVNDTQLFAWETLELELS
jgi:hypothetical protein